MDSIPRVRPGGLRGCLGLAILLGAGWIATLNLLALARESWTPALYLALHGGLLCALGTALGALPVLLVRDMSARVADSLLGFGAGVMLSASAFSLILPALQAAGDAGHPAWMAGVQVSAALCLGALTIAVLGRLLERGRSEVERTAADAIPSRILLFVLAIVLHNIPEGMAVGVAAGGEVAGASGLALGIALQDAPEGLAIALVLAGAGMSRGRAVLIGAASGLVEPIFAVLCAALVGVGHLFLVGGLGAAAGAMLYVVAREVIPESQRRGYAAEATVGLLLGFCLMMVLDTSLG
ncbi:MAG: Zinc transporter ZupT [Pseudomonas citronellolis]|nr:MAG: Zinc transporter ZupT [Pseudomonas citronellolis]